MSEHVVKFRKRKKRKVSFAAKNKVRYFNRDNATENIDSDNDYKHLIPGECVSLKVRYIPSNDENKQYSCENVTGLLGTKLLFENEDYTYIFYRKKNE